MSSADEDVGALHRQGFSIRAIAKRLGLSRSAVHRRVSRPAEAEPDEYGDEDAAPHDDYQLHPNFGPPAGCRPSHKINLSDDL